jgi:hypothetical protein
MALDYLLYFIICENIIQYSINIYQMIQIYNSLQNVPETEEVPREQRQGQIPEKSICKKTSVRWGPI